MRRLTNTMSLSGWRTIRDTFQRTTAFSIEIFGSRFFSVGALRTLFVGRKVAHMHKIQITHHLFTMPSNILEHRLHIFSISLHRHATYVPKIIWNTFSHISFRPIFMCCVGRHIVTPSSQNPKNVWSKKWIRCIYWGCSMFVSGGVVYNMLHHMCGETPSSSSYCVFHTCRIQNNFTKVDVHWMSWAHLLCAMTSRSIHFSHRIDTSQNVKCA